MGINRGSEILFELLKKVLFSSFWGFGGVLLGDLFFFKVSLLVSNLKIHLQNHNFSSSNLTICFTF
ncbi:hypothetical protein AR685_08805 [Chryseobacterium sp. JAH]|nr:hypothetical protein AR685_08805 [Chryseobacterium sp. JAH]